MKRGYIVLGKRKNQIANKICRRANYPLYKGCSRRVFKEKIVSWDRYIQIVNRK